MSDRKSKSTLGDLEVSVVIQNLNLNYRSKTVLRDLNWAINSGENWLLTGASGSGKTALAKIIAGLEKAVGNVKIEFNYNSNLPKKVHYVASWYQFTNLEGVANFYYQQRYTSQQAKDVITVNAELGNYGKENNLKVDELEVILKALNFTAFKNSQLIELSSGEHKMLQLIKAIWLKPQLLIIDQPYTGLDFASRDSLNILLDQIVEEGVQLIIISNDPELPASINRFAVITNGELEELYSINLASALPENASREIPSFLTEAIEVADQTLIKMTDVNISYGEKQVLKNINWEVKAGEKWLLQGHNGSGKSTLLSLINGDHPQAYANNIDLFGSKRGSGESIWEIKERIGLISPEFHWYFDATATVWQSIASGFYDTVGLFQQLPYSKSKQVDELLDCFGLTADKNETLNTLPLGKQRLVLLARTIIKNPQLLILDEPCQGLDQQQTQYFNQLVDDLCHNGMTVIYVGHFEAQLPKCLTHKLVLSNGEVLKNSKAYTTQKELA